MVVYPGVREIISAGTKAKAVSNRGTKKRRGGNGHAIITSNAGVGRGTRRSGLASRGSSTLDSRNGNNAAVSSKAASAGVDVCLGEIEAAMGTGGVGMPEREVRGSPESGLQVGVGETREALLVRGDGDEEGKELSRGVLGGKTDGNEDNSKTSGNEDNNNTDGNHDSNKTDGNDDSETCGNDNNNNTDGNGNVNSNDNSNDKDPFELLSPEKLASFDIVLTTFEVLRAEIHHSETKFSGAGRGEKGGQGRALRRKKRFGDFAA